MEIDLLHLCQVNIGIEFTSRRLNKTTILYMLSKKVVQPLQRKTVVQPSKVEKDLEESHLALKMKLRN